MDNFNKRHDCSNTMLCPTKVYSLETRDHPRLRYSWQCSHWILIAHHLCFQFWQVLDWTNVWPFLHLQMLNALSLIYPWKLLQLHSLSKELHCSGYCILYCICIWCSLQNNCSAIGNIHIPSPGTSWIASPSLSLSLPNNAPSKSPRSNVNSWPCSYELP